MIHTYKDTKQKEYHDQLIKIFDAFMEAGNVEKCFSMIREQKNIFEAGNKTNPFPFHIYNEMVSKMHYYTVKL